MRREWGGYLSNTLSRPSTHLHPSNLDTICSEFMRVQGELENMPLYKSKNMSLCSLFFALIKFCNVGGGRFGISLVRSLCVRMCSICVCVAELNKNL